MPKTKKLSFTRSLCHHRIKLVGKPKWYKRSKEILKYILPELLMNSKKRNRFSQRLTVLVVARHKNKRETYSKMDP